MPRFEDILAEEGMEERKLPGSHFGYSAKGLGELDATEYTLVTLAIDESGSVYPYKKGIDDMIKNVIRACRRSPRADNLMFRTLLFHSSVREYHGFKPLTECPESGYDDLVQCGGATALFDAAYNGVEAMTDYAKNLMENDYNVNAILFVITDGQDNNSVATANMVHDAIEKSRNQEIVESMVSVLVGVTSDDNVLDSYLQNVKDGVGFTQYVSIGNASEKNLAKLADFVSQSVSSQSQALGTGGPSQSITF